MSYGIRRRCSNRCDICSVATFRACLFETAADYHDGDILDDLAPALSRLGYRCEEGVIHTNMASFSRRKILVGTRSVGKLLLQRGSWL